MAKIAGFMHDIGNAVNREHHAEYGALLANEILKNTDMALEDRVTIVSAIGNHDESTGGAKDAILIICYLESKPAVICYMWLPQDFLMCTNPFKCALLLFWDKGKVQNMHNMCILKYYIDCTLAKIYTGLEAFAKKFNVSFDELLKRFQSLYQIYVHSSRTSD